MVGHITSSVLPSYAQYTVVIFMLLFGGSKMTGGWWLGGKVSDFFYRLHWSKPTEVPDRISMNLSSCWVRLHANDWRKH